MPSKRWPKPPRLQRLFRFAVTGALATALHVGVATLLITKVGALPYVANSLAFLVATGFSYATNTAWSFASRMNHRTLWRYASVSAFGCLATAAIAAAADAAHLGYRFGILLVIVIVTPINFTLHSLWTYRVPR